MKANTCNKTGGLDIFSIRLSRRKQGFNSPWDYQNNIVVLTSYESRLDMTGAVSEADGF
jgi:hypothetical protein